MSLVQRHLVQRPLQRRKERKAGPLADLPEPQKRLEPEQRELLQLLIPREMSRSLSLSELSQSLPP